jgi:hypothetical protein
MIMYALDDFTEHWRDQPSFLVDYSGNSTFLARVEYHSEQIHHSHSTVVRIRKHGKGAGQISLQKAPALLLGFPQLMFSPPLHIYNYDRSSHALLVQGHSNLLGGDYHVVITPA